MSTKIRWELIEEGVDAEAVVSLAGAGGQATGCQGPFTARDRIAGRAFRHAVSNVLSRAPRAPAATEWNPSAARLSQREREEIRAALARGQSYTLIARLIGRATSTVAREVAANGGRLDYQAWRAHRRAAAQARWV